MKTKKSRNPARLKPSASLTGDGDLNKEPSAQPTQSAEVNLDEEVVEIRVEPFRLKPGEDRIDAVIKFFNGFLLACHEIPEFEVSESMVTHSTTYGEDSVELKVSIKQ